MFFTHLHALAGKCLHTLEQIESDITSWVRTINEDGETKDTDKECVKIILDTIFKTCTVVKISGSSHSRTIQMTL